jgi:indole-3-glycerol phosphate synthase/phosphoribosylanthranilate isomerase
VALDRILEHKRREVAARKAAAPLETLLAECPRSDRDFEAALRHGRPGFVLEVKTHSPSAGAIRAGDDLDQVLDAYGRHADAVSVLTDERFFGGSLDRLRRARGRLRQPLLCKDFTLEPYQVAEARRAGADAVLLILAAVDDATWRDCAALAGRLGMAVLTEAHDADEVRRAVALGARIVGINHRDLRTLVVDRDTAVRLAPLVPPDRLVVAESGIDSRADVERLRPCADAVLVGSALMREADIDAAVRRLVYGRTKVCGLTDPAHARAAWEAGATHGGLVFAAGSPRRLTGARAAAVRSGAPLEWVGVFARPSAGDVADAARRLGLAAVQLHGDESPEEVAAVRRGLPAGCAVWKAVRAARPLPLRAGTGADRLLVDGGPGGTGVAFDWSALYGYAERGEVLVAGGLAPANAEAAAGLGAWGLDASSGLESSPGVKDGARLRAFFAARRRLAGRGDGER